MKKQIKISILLMAVLIVALSMVSSASEDKHIIFPKFIFDKPLYNSGETVNMSLILTGVKNTDKTNSVTFEIEYDGNTFVLENDSVEKDIKGGYIPFTTKYDVGAGKSKKISIMYVDMNKDIKLKDGKDIVTVKFKVKDNAPKGAKVFKLNPVKMFDSSFKACNINDAKLYVNAIEIGNSSSTKVVINDQLIQFDVPPQIIKGRTLVPMRKIFEELGAEVEWDSTTRTVIGKKGDLAITLKIDSEVATINQNRIKLDVPATIINGRTLVPARFISESLGLKVYWDGATKTVLITQ